MEKNFNKTLNKYLSANYDSYNFLIHNLTFDCAKNLLKNFFDEMFQNDLMLRKYCKYFDGRNFSRECIDSIKLSFSNKDIERNAYYRFVVIYNINDIDIAYINMLLKTTEDLDTRVVFIFIADNGFNILNTLKSRCFLIDYSFFLKEHHANEIINIYSDEEILDILISKVDNYYVLDCILEFFLKKIEVLKLDKSTKFFENFDKFNNAFNIEKSMNYSCEYKISLLNFLR